jgi:hypothetical protein
MRRGASLLTLALRHLSLTQELQRLAQGKITPGGFVGIGRRCPGSRGIFPFRLREQARVAEPRRAPLDQDEERQQQHAGRERHLILRNQAASAGWALSAGTGAIAHG